MNQSQIMKKKYHSRLPCSDVDCKVLQCHEWNLSGYLCLRELGSDNLSRDGFLDHTAVV